VTTVVAREAEWQGQINAWLASTNYTIFGRGIGSVFYLDEKISQLADYNDMDEFLYGASYAGHSYWVANFTAGGLLTGWIMPAVLIAALVLNFDALIKLRSLLSRSGASSDTICKDLQVLTKLFGQDQDRVAAHQPSGQLGVQPLNHTAHLIHAPGLPARIDLGDRSRGQNPVLYRQAGMLNRL
jgi:hypothetical protein